MALLSQSSVLADRVNYTIAGSFYADPLEVIQYDDLRSDKIYLDAYLNNASPIDVLSSYSTVTFSVGKSIEGNTGLFSSLRNF